MKLRKIAYWISTAFVTLIMTVSGGMAMLHSAAFMKAMAHLGYPSYFANILGIGKFIGIIVFVAPRLPRLKEWSYAGFTIAVVSATYSHYSTGDRLQALDPVVTFVALLVSYFARPSDRKLPESVVL
jgi:uncharacterized membrane protein YphA (DoxX/SURF4 family)